MSIKSIYIKNIVAFKYINIEFHSNVSILIGANGTGKTMALKAIYNKIKDIKPGEHDIIPERLDIEYSKDHKPGQVWMMEEDVNERWLDIQLQNLFAIDEKTRKKALKIAGELNTWKKKKYKEFRFISDTWGLSYGEKKLLMIATWLACAKEGDMIILDQPENGLHIAVQDELIDLIEDKKGVQAIIVTHSPHILNGHFDELADTPMNPKGSE